MSHEKTDQGCLMLNQQAAKHQQCKRKCTNAEQLSGTDHTRQLTLLLDVEKKGFWIFDPLGLMELMSNSDVTYVPLVEMFCTPDHIMHLSLHDSSLYQK